MSQVSSKESVSGKEEEFNPEKCNCSSWAEKIDIGLIEACKKLKDDKYTGCFENSDTLSCMKYRCRRRNFNIFCTNDDCKNGKWSYIYAMSTNIGKENIIGQDSDIWICFDNNKGKDVIRFEQIILHELFHLCDKDAVPPLEPTLNEKTPCSDWRNYTMNYCVYNDTFFEEWEMKSKTACEEAKKPKDNNGQKKYETS